jgi:hypothetical protein
MTTKKMYDDGLRCKGRGFNCPGRKEKEECVEYVRVNAEPKPPLGIIPKKIWDLQRLNDLNEAINRYTAFGKEIPIEWVGEYNNLVKLYKE